MANEVNFGWATGKTLTFAVFTSAGVQRETGTSMTETPASSGLYLGSPTTIQVGDNVIIREGSREIGHGVYGASAIEGGGTIVIPAGYVGDYREDDAVYFFWRTNVALDTAGTIKVYKDNNTGEATAPTGITDTRNYDSKTGVHFCGVDLSANSFYKKETDCIVVLSGGVAGSKTINTIVGSFSIENRYQGMKFSKHDG